MAATNYTPIQLYRTTTAGAALVASQTAVIGRVCESLAPNWAKNEIDDFSTAGFSPKATRCEPNR